MRDDFLKLINIVLLALYGSSHLIFYMELPCNGGDRLCLRGRDIHLFMYNSCIVCYRNLLFIQHLLLFQAKFDENPRKEFLHLLGYDAAKIRQKVSIPVHFMFMDFFLTCQSNIDQQCDRTRRA